MYTPPSATVPTEVLRPVWMRYIFAAAVSGLAWMLAIWIDTFVSEPVTPFLAGFGAVIASATVAGFGPSLLSTALVSAWSLTILIAEARHSPAGMAIRIGMFAIEGVLLSFGSLGLRRATNQVARSADWHRRLVETSGEGIWVFDDAGCITYANPRIAEILGCSVAELVGRRREDFFFPADLSVERIRFKNRHAGQKEQFDRRLRRVDGSEAWLLTCSNPIIDDKGQFQGVLSMMTDITERKRAEYALRRSEEKFRSLFENVLEGVYQSTPDGRILAANPMLLRMLGLTSEAQLNDVNIADDLYVDKSVRQRLLERLEQDGTFQNVEYQLRRRDGQVISVLENARVVRDEEGHILYYEGTLSDTTEQKRIEEQLRQAQKMEALGRLAGGVAQDFSNILTIISGYGRLLLDDLPPGHPARSSAENVVHAAANAHGLTNQLLSFSRRRSLPVPEVDFNAVVRSAAEALPAAMGPQCRVTLNLSSGAVPIAVDRVQVEQIVVGVAQKFRPLLPVGSGLELRTEQIEIDETRGRRQGVRPGPYVALSFRCVGEVAGICSDLEPLTLNSAVAQLGGFITVEMSPNKGPVVAVFLPMAGVDGRNFAEPAGILDYRHSPERILLVNGEPLVRELSRDILERQGYEVTLAGDPAEAGRISETGTAFDLLITDLTTEADSADLVKALRDAQPNLKVLYISGYAESNPEVPLPESGDSFLQKPFSADSLGRKIRQILTRP